MARISAESFDVGYMDTLASGDSPLHRLDPRAKLISTLLFIVAVVSFGKYEVSALVPFAIYPVFLIAAGGLPAGYLARKVLIVSPFAVFVGVFNPVLDRDILFTAAGLGVSGGWVSFASILLRFALTVSAALAMVSLTGVNSICEALMRLRVPKAFVVQLMFLNRFINVLAGEGDRMSRARSLRSGGRRLAPGLFAQLAGHLLLRSLDRAERVYRAMLCRGFDGHVRVARFSGAGTAELLFVAAWAALFILFRCVNLPLILGSIFT